MTNLVAFNTPRCIMLVSALALRPSARIIEMVVVHKSSHGYDLVEISSAEFVEHCRRSS
jgi:hypothetical protein